MVHGAVRCEWFSNWLAGGATLSRCTGLPWPSEPSCCGCVGRARAGQGTAAPPKISLFFSGDRNLAELGSVSAAMITWMLLLCSRGVPPIAGQLRPHSQEMGGWEQLLTLRLGHRAVWPRLCALSLVTPRHTGAVPGLSFPSLLSQFVSALRGSSCVLSLYHSFSCKEKLKTHTLRKLGK